MKTFNQFITESTLRQGGRSSLVPSRGAKNKQETKKRRAFNLTKALQKRMGTRAPIKGGVGEYTHATRDPDDVLTDVETFINPAHYGAAHSPKVTIKDGKKKVISSQQRAFKAKQFMRQLTKSRKNPQGKVHVVDIEPNLQRDHGDKENLRQRTKNFKRAVANVPNVVRAAGAQRGDYVSGAPGQPQGIKGVPREAGTRSRARLYTQIPGAGNYSRTTGRIVGRVR